MTVTERQKQLIERLFNGELGVVNEESKTGILFTLNALNVEIKFTNGRLIILSVDKK